MGARVHASRAPSLEDPDLFNPFRRSEPRTTLAPLYAAVVARARQPEWYLNGVPDTFDGRFDMVASILALVLLRLEREGEATRQPQVLLAETFVDDMDGVLRQMGVGDLMVGKHVGKMMGALGGRLTAYRDALGSGDMVQVVRRNIFRDNAAPNAHVAFVADRLHDVAREVDAVPLDALLAGRIA